jgi:IS5 family transposase
MLQNGFFDIDDCYARIDKAGDPLSRLDSVVDWSGLSELMSGVVLSPRIGSIKRGRPSFCGLLMAKILLLQSLNNLSDESCEYLINDRLSFKRFLGLGVHEKSPDARTIWLWRERIVQVDLQDKIFSWFDAELTRSGYEAKGGQIVDATFVPTHKPTGRQKKQVEAGTPLTASQVVQLDPDATFTKKRNTTYHGYKNHTCVDARHKLIRKCSVTTASVHDSQELVGVLIAPAYDALPEDRSIWADSAYRSEAAEKMLRKRGLVSQVHQRSYRNTPLDDLQKAANRLKSKVRVRVEHVYGQMNTQMGGLMIHTIGLARAKVKVVFKNIAYNMMRFAYLQKREQQRPQCA